MITEFKYFYPEKPRLVNIKQPLFQTMSDSKLWVAERKYNGTRLQLHCLNGQFHFWNRHESQLDYRPDPETRKALAALPLPAGYCLFDGELRHNKTVGVYHKIMLYDVFIWKNELLVDKPFWYRRNLLKSMLVCGGEPVGTPEQFPNDFHAAFDKVTAEGDEIEGLVMKNMNGMLQLGRTAGIDSKWMYKVRKPSGRYRF